MNSDCCRKYLGFVFLAIPFMAMMLMIGMNMRNLGHTEYRLVIEGYDPRDLLKGHYLIFRYKWPEDARFPENKHPPYACACFSGETSAPDVSFNLCPDRKAMASEACPAFIKVARNGASFQPYEAMRRYYIPEEHAPMIENMLRSGKHIFEVGLVPREKGDAQIKMLYINYMALDEFLQGDLTPYLQAP